MGDNKQVPYYPYRDDGRKINKVIGKFANKFVNRYVFYMAYSSKKLERFSLA